MRGFLAEARMLAQFKHPALVEVLRFWEQNGTAYMVMPYYRGRTLRRVLRDDEIKVDETWLKTVFSPLMDALEMMHAQNVYHRDFSPDNILVLESGAPVLLDLGAARHITGSMSQAVTAVLKPGFAPIEQYADDGSASQGPWTDIYAIGAVLYFCITGKPPAASVSRILKDSLEYLDATVYRGFSDAFFAGIHRALALSPEDRPQTIAELRSILDISATLQAGYAPATRPGRILPADPETPSDAGAGVFKSSPVTGRPSGQSVPVSLETAKAESSDGGDAVPAAGAAVAPELAGEPPAKPWPRLSVLSVWMVVLILAVGVLAWSLRPDERVTVASPPPRQAPQDRVTVPSKTLEVPAEKPFVKTAPGKPEADPGATSAPVKQAASARPQSQAPAPPGPRSRASRCMALLDKASLGIDVLTEEELDYVKTKCK